MQVSKTAIATVVLISCVADLPTGASAKRTKIRNLFKRKNNDDANERGSLHDVAFLKEAMSDEDAQYWDRILQMSASVPTAPSVPTARPPTVRPPTPPVPPPSPPTPAPTPENFATCVDSGGEVENAMCCQGVGDFPNTCVVGACGCSPFESEMVLVCLCPDGQCFDGFECVEDATAPTASPPTNPAPTAPAPTAPPPTVPAPTAPAPTNPPPTNPPPTNPPPTNPPPTNPAPAPTATAPTPGAASSFSFVRRTRRQRRIRKRSSNDA
mmetsp:Transcript_3657/g.8289  ORF Transcript_3657/g.8289 Transcript_3657/m.8289 type:complete len:268 (+) Transcript_3657:352-1155(+)